MSLADKSITLEFEGTVKVEAIADFDGGETYVEVTGKLTADSADRLRSEMMTVEFQRKLDALDITDVIGYVRHVGRREFARQLSAAGYELRYVGSRPTMEELD